MLVGGVGVVSRSSGLACLSLRLRSRGGSTRRRVFCGRGIVLLLGRTLFCSAGPGTCRSVDLAWFAVPSVLGWVGVVALLVVAVVVLVVVVVAVVVAVAVVVLVGGGVVRVVGVGVVVAVLVVAVSVLGLYRLGVPCPFP